MSQPPRKTRRSLPSRGKKHRFRSSGVVRRIPGIEDRHPASGAELPRQLLANPIAEHLASFTWTREW